MKHFFALPALLRTATLLATASQHSFSVQDDLLAFPQYDVHYNEEDWISDEDAVGKLLNSVNWNFGAPREEEEEETPPPSEIELYPDGRPKPTGPAKYERMVLNGQAWLCRVPKVKKPSEVPNTKNDTLTKADEEKELARATDRGWELLSSMQGNCIFFISGWWSYRFCYNQGVKQFHQLPPSRGVPVYPPVEDPNVQGFLLGTYEKRIQDDNVQKNSWEGERALEKSETAKGKRSGPGELVQRGDSRYLVQKLGGGTLCDLTGKERSVEVQFHCNPSAADRISLIKETSTCNYLMIIQTPKLCSDVAFLPPQKDQPNPISCQPILFPEEIEPYEKKLQALKAHDLEAKAQEALAEAAAAFEGIQNPHILPVGDIYVGERRLVPEGQTIEKSAIVGGGKETYVDTVASSDGKVLPKDQLEKLGLGDPKNVEELKKKLEKIAQGQTWKLDVIDTPRGREYRGIIGDDEDDKQGDARETKGAKGKDTTEASKEQKKTKQAKQGTGKKREGSEEEYYHEEL